MTEPIQPIGGTPPSKGIGPAPNLQNQPQPPAEVQRSAVADGEQVEATADASAEALRSDAAQLANLQRLQALVNQHQYPIDPFAIAKSLVAYELFRP
ncbi:MAG: hypothetical protein IMW91_00090 [Firmicutes bacterium]|nr:hypothetical protein [Bacillota bacterium]